jgi:hypothetical protein
MRRIASLVGLAALLSAAVFAQTAKLDQDKHNLATLEKAYKSSKATYSKKPKDPVVKKRYVSATVAFATATMNTQTQTSKQKYPGALRLYREALKADPKNREALENSRMIEDIYRSMHRPIPK